MPCSECQQNRQRVEKAEEAERLLLLFTDLFSKLAQALSEIEAEHLRRYYEANPPPPGAAPGKRRRYLLVRMDRVEGETVNVPQDQPASA